MYSGIALPVSLLCPSCLFYPLLSLRPCQIEPPSANLNALLVCRYPSPILIDGVCRTPLSFECIIGCHARCRNRRRIGIWSMQVSWWSFPLTQCVPYSLYVYLIRFALGHPASAYQPRSHTRLLSLNRGSKGSSVREGEVLRHCGHPGQSRVGLIHCPGPTRVHVNFAHP